jgi:hypothetical protein
MGSSMQLQARLVHAEPGHRVVEITAHRQGQLLGSALGEAATAEQAEDRALMRLQARLRNLEMAVAIDQPPAEPRPPAPQAAPQPVPAAAQPEPLPAREAAANAAVPSDDPEDWSSELAQIDLELRRLDWGRDQEGTYLERAFGHPSRSRLTSYADLLTLLRSLQSLEAGSDPSRAPVPLRRSELLAQSDALMTQLRWDAAMGKRFLEANLQVSSRQQLSDTQLLQFNMLLEEQILALSR